MLVFLGYAGALMLALGIYLYFVIRRALALLWGERKKMLQRALSAVAAVCITLPSYNLFGVWALITLHFAAASLLVDLVWLILKKTGKITHPRWDLFCRSGVAAIVIAAAVLGYAYFNMHLITTQEYTVSTSKSIRQEGYRIVFVSDLHFGTTMDIKKLEAYCRRMETEKPDLVVLGGDIVDEATTLKEARQAFTALANIKSSYGTYYVYGNHDKGRYASDCDFTEQELSQVIREAGVTVLEDDTVPLNPELSLTGRMDQYDAIMGQVARTPSKELLDGMPSDGFHILADHQPCSMMENAASGYDLMLSGHTHAGQMWPVGLLTTLLDKDTLNYGQKTYGAMELIVSSGIAGWGYPFRTGKHCEYVIVRILPETGRTACYHMPKKSSEIEKKLT